MRNTLETAANEVDPCESPMRCALIELEKAILEVNNRLANLEKRMNCVLRPPPCHPTEKQDSPAYAHTLDGTIMALRDQVSMAALQIAEMDSCLII